MSLIELIKSSFVKQKYLIRLDDACPTTAWKKWEPFEELFDTTGVKPLVSVIPDNQDKKLFLEEPKLDFGIL